MKKVYDQIYIKRKLYIKKIIYKENLKSIQSNLYIKKFIIISQIFLYYIWFMDMKSKHKTREALFMFINYPFLYMV